MEQFKVIEVLNGDQIKVSPQWAWQGEEGDIVVVFGYTTPQKGMEGFEFAKKKLQKLIEGRMVELFRPMLFSKYGKDKLVCSVYLDGIDIANFFPEFRNRRPGFIKGFDDFNQ
jgi:hypothetical protein